MKVDTQKLKRMPANPTRQVRKVDLHRMEELGLYQISKQNPNPEKQWMPERHGIRVDYRRMEMIGVSIRPADDVMTSFSAAVRQCCKWAAAACFVVIVGLSVIFIRPVKNIKDGKTQTEFEALAVTYRSDTTPMTGRADAEEPIVKSAVLKEADIPKPDNLENIEESPEEPIEEEQPEEEVSEEPVLLAMANVEQSLNVRVEPSETAEKAGLLYNNTGGTILEREDGWTKIQSGDLVGWVKDDFMAFDKDAVAIAEEAKTFVATVHADSLNVRKSAEEDAPVLGSVKAGDTLAITGALDEPWTEVEYKGNTAFVSADYIDIEEILPTGETIEAIQKREAEEKAEAEKAAKRYGSGISLSQSELNMLAAIIFCEAGNQPYDGKVAVGAVVVNRVLSGRFPGSIEAVLRSPGQFQPVPQGRFDSVYVSGSWGASCYQAAVDAANGAKGGVGGALFFRNPNKSGAHPGITIGDHVFW